MNELIEHTLGVIHGLPYNQARSAVGVMIAALQHEADTRYRSQAEPQLLLTHRRNGQTMTSTGGRF